MNTKTIESTLSKIKDSEILKFSEEGDQYQVEIKKTSSQVKISKNGEEIYSGKGLDVDIPWADGVPLIKIKKAKAFLMGFSSADLYSIWFKGTPVQNSYADPGVQIKSGKAAFGFLIFIFGMKTFAGPVLTTFVTHEGRSFFTSLVGSLVLYGPLLVLSIDFLIFYKSIPLVSIIAGLVLAVIELLDYGYGLFLKPESAGGAMTVFWIILRFSFIFLLVRPLISMIKLKKENQSKPEID